MKVKCNYHIELSSLYLMGDLCHSLVERDNSSCWRDNTEGHKQLRMFLEGIGDNFLTIQVIKELTS